MRIEPILKKLSKISALPLLKSISPAVNIVPEAEDLEGFLQCQRLAYRAVREVAKLMNEGWTEAQTAKMIDTFLRDNGVKGYFHHPFAWFGERTKFEGMKHYRDFQPSRRVLRPNEVFILDVAPISRGYVADIGYTSALAPAQTTFPAIQNFLKSLRGEIPSLFSSGLTGAQIWREIERRMEREGYSNAYKIYPFGVLGHRVHRVSEKGEWAQVLHFGWQSYWSLASRGLFGQLLGPFFEGDLTGIWAIEPHLGGEGFGAKFEEILVVTKDPHTQKTEARWLEEYPEKAWY